MATTNERWEGMWERDFIPWQRDVVDVLLQKYLPQLAAGSPAPLSILVPLCGKTLDIPWLCEVGHHVVGVELSEKAAKELFQEHSIPHSISEQGGLRLYNATDRSLKYFVGDFFELSSDLHGTFDLIWECNSIVAIPMEDRSKYVAKLHSLLKPKGKILMTTWEYDQAEHSGFPFSMPFPVIRELCLDLFDTKELECVDYSNTLFTEQFNLTWGKKPCLLLTRKT